MGARTLQELRAAWEDGLAVTTQFGSDSMVYVVLSRPELPGYACHRYVDLGDKWDVSIDLENCSADRAIQWIGEQAAEELAMLLERNSEFEGKSYV